MRWPKMAGAKGTSCAGHIRQGRDRTAARKAADRGRGRKAEPSARQCKTRRRSRRHIHADIAHRSIARLSRDGGARGAFGSGRSRGRCVCRVEESTAPPEPPRRRGGGLWPLAAAIVIGAAIAVGGAFGLHHFDHTAASLACARDSRRRRSNSRARRSKHCRPARQRSTKDWARSNKARG